MTPDKTPSEAELLPCPFCGEAAKHSFNSLYGDMSMASCKSCGATAYAPKWNRRAVLAKWGQRAQAGQAVAWLDPWTGTKVTTDYDAYGKQGIPLYTQQPAAQDAARLDWLERAGPTSICVVMDRLHDGEYEVAPDDSPGGYGKTLRAAIDASIAAQQGEKT